MKKIIIIGAGISGLSAGCYAAMNGYQVEVYEMHSSPGGVCTSWKRKDYLFDHCLHWVIGSNKGNSMYPLFKELCITDTVEFYHTDRFRSIQCEGKDITIYTDIDKLEKELTDHFPQEKRMLQKMMRQVRFYTHFHPPMDAEFGRFGFMETLKMLPFIPSFLMLKGITVRKYIERFRNPLLREVLFRMFPVPEMPAPMVIMPLAYFHNHEGGYPMGGSLHFAQAVADRFTRLGGEIHYNQRISKIIVKEKKAVGVETEDGEKHYADIVISACDGRTTLFDMLEGKYISPPWKEIFKKPALWPPLVSVSLGVRRDLSGEVELQAFKLNLPIEICGQKLDWINYCHYCQDPAFAPEGKSVITLQFETDYAYWKELYADKAAYRREKQQVLNKLLDALETRLPGIREKIFEK